MSIFLAGINLEQTVRSFDFLRSLLENSSADVVITVLYDCRETLRGRILETHKKMSISSDTEKIFSSGAVKTTVYVSGGRIWGWELGIFSFFFEILKNTIIFGLCATMFRLMSITASYESMKALSAAKLHQKN